MLVIVVTFVRIQLTVWHWLDPAMLSIRLSELASDECALYHGKGNGSSFIIVTIAAYASRAALSLPTEPAYSLGRNPKPCSRNLAFSHTAVALVCRFNGFHLRNP